MILLVSHLSRPAFDLTGNRSRRSRVLSHLIAANPLFALNLAELMKLKFIVRAGLALIIGAVSARAA